MLEPVTRDRYGRAVARVCVDRVCLNKELLKAGIAWHHKRCSKEKELAELEVEAREKERKKIRLWSNPHPSYPVATLPFMPFCRWNSSQAESARSLYWLE